MKTDSRQQLSVFLCHGSEDKPAVRELYQRLKGAGVKPWLDELDILPGQDWDNAIRKAVRASDVILVCLSRASVAKSGYLQKEIRFALDLADEKPEGAIFLIPVKLEECELPERLQRWHWVDLSTEQGFDNLLRALQSCTEAAGEYRAASVKQLQPVNQILPPKSQVTSNSNHRTKIVMALIAALVTILVTYIMFAPKPPGEKEPQFTGRVSDARTEKRLRNAKVTLEVQGVPPVIYTDSEGIFTFPLKNASGAIHIQAEAVGYQNYDRRIPLFAKAEGEIEDIRLEPAPPVPSPTVKLTPRPAPAEVLRPPAPPLRLKVKGTYRRDVYYTPNGSIIGKVEPGTVLRVAEVITVNGLRWYRVNLENGDMYTITRPIETLTTGWVAELAVEKK